MGRELTVVLDAGKWVRVFRNTNTSPDAYPRERLWVCRPVESAQMQVNVHKTHAPRRANFPYDIEVSDYDDTGRHLGFVGGADYYEKEAFIKEAQEAVTAAKQIAKNHGLFVVANP